MRVYRNGNYTASYLLFVAVSRTIALVIVICGCALAAHLAILVINQPVEPTVQYHFDQFDNGPDCDEAELIQGESCK